MLCIAFCPQMCHLQRLTEGFLFIARYLHLKSHFLVIHSVTKLYYAILCVPASSSLSAPSATSGAAGASRA